MYNSIGSLHSDKSEHTKALEYYFLALELNEKLGSKLGIADSYLNIGQTYHIIGKVNDSKIWLKQALKHAKELGSKELLKNSYLHLAKADSSINNFSGALENYKYYILYRDSLNNEDNTKKIVQAQMQYEFDKKEEATKLEQEKKDAIAKAEKQRQQIVLLLISFVLLLVFAFSIFIFRSLKITRKQKSIIENQKNIVEHQKHLVEEKQKEIIDSINYAKRIQQSILPSEKYIANKLKKN